MPIIIKDYTWKQTNQEVIIRIPVKDVSFKQVDIFTSKYYVKVHYAPFLFEVCLYSSIIEDESKCTFGNGEAVLVLVKETPEHWEALSKDLTKQEQIDVKLKAIEYSQNKTKEDQEKKRELKNQRQKAAVEEAMGIDSKERSKLEEVKNALKLKANEEIEHFRINQSKQLAIKFGEKTCIKTEIVSEKKNKNIWKVKREVKKVKDTSVAGIRETGSITVSFTPRSFPTPCRESYLEQKNEWLKNQAEARRATGFMFEDLRPEENNPQWLLDKGRSFLAVDNYKGAISAFTHGIKLSDKMVELYVERSKAQIGLGNFRRVILDTNKAQELLKPHCEANAELRFTCHMNTARALLGLNMPKQALGELEFALEIKPFDEPCSALIDTAENMMENWKEEQLSKTSYLNPEDLE